MKLPAMLESLLASYCYIFSVKSRWVQTNKQQQWGKEDQKHQK
jgi:hypothetical protein